MERLWLQKESDRISVELNNVVESIETNADFLLFDRWLLDTWDDLFERTGVFRYKLNIEREKALEGQHPLLLQLNEDRSIKRRAPELITSITQAFDPNKFNFNKISELEIMFTLQVSNNFDSNESTHKIIINDSPINRGHSLFCPNIEECLPQIITLTSLKLACYLMFLSNNRDLRVGFNSLGGMASVNHLHYHIFSVNFRLPIETAKCSRLKGNLYESVDYPAKAFCFEITTKEQIFEICLEIYKLVCFLIDNNIAHNLYLTKGKSLSGECHDVLRIFVWARSFYHSQKELCAINLAICEFSGHFNIKSAEQFEELTYDFIAKCFEEVTLPVFNNIKERVIQLY